MRRRAAWAVLSLLALTAMALFYVPSGAPSAEAASGSAVTKHKTLSRNWYTGDQAVQVDERDVSVTVGTTRQLQGRQRVQVSWSGAHPTGGRASDPTGANGLAQEYPVVILQCRGIDGSATHPLSQKTCWTSTSNQRTVVQDTGGLDDAESPAVWLDDQYAAAADLTRQSGPSTGCGLPADQAIHVTPFVDAAGKTWKGCNSDTMPPEAAVSSSLPAAEVSAFTGTNGRGSFDFEVRSLDQNASLGCSNSVPCSIVVIPIMGISCTVNSQFCTGADAYAPGSSYDGTSPNPAVTPLYWWSASNWRGRLSFPITMAKDLQVCSLANGSNPVSFYGSELLYETALQWAPAYCLNAKRFAYQQVSMSDSLAFNQMLGRTAAAAYVTSAHAAGTAQVAYAPTAVTGFAIGYVIDRPGNGGEYTSLRLNARLLAKLLTESYPASSLGTKHPGLSSNPWTLVKDPEFQRLNPGLAKLYTQESQATLEAISIDSDVIEAITSYIATDADAMAFINGKADPWGMKVNPYYKGIKLPVSTWPLNDKYVASNINQCATTSPYLSLVAAPVTRIFDITNDLINAWPRQATNCSGTGAWATLGRASVQGLGSRFMLGITDLGDAARYGIRTAKLQTKGTTYVAPTDASLAAAVGVASSSGVGTPYTMSMKAIRAVGKAYPGTAIVSTAALTKGGSATTAGHVAQFIRTSVTEGQVPGLGNGNLAAGYLPIRSTGVTAKLYQRARSVADLVQAQQGNPATSTSGGSGGSGGSTSGSSSGSSAGSGSGSSGAASTTPAANAATHAGTDHDAGAKKQITTAVATDPTSAVRSRWGALMLPMLLFVALLAGGSSALLRLLAREKQGS